MRRFLALLLLLSPASISPTAALAESATLAVNFEINGAPLENPELGRFYVYEPERRDYYLDWGRADRPVSVPAGEYDVVVRYRHDQVVRETVWEKLPLAGDVVRDVSWNAEEAELTIDVVSGGVAVSPLSGRYSIFRQGRRGEPIVARRPGQPTVIEAGVYDVEVAVRDAVGLKSRWIEGYRLEGSRREVVDLGVAPAQLTITMLVAGKPVLASEGSWRVYSTGTDRRLVANSRSGDTVSLTAGVYDVEMAYTRGGATITRRLRSLDVLGDERREVELTTERARLGVEVLLRERPARTAWFSVHAPGDRNTPIATAPSGASVELDGGVYDIGCFAQDGDYLAEGWLKGRRVEDGDRLEATIDYRPATLRVQPGGGETPMRSSAILVVLDSSAEMRESLGGMSRIRVAREVLRRAGGRLEGSDLDLGLRVFGISPPNLRDCSDSVMLTPVGRVDAAKLTLSLDLLRPGGQAPVAHSLEEAASDLDSSSRNTVVVLTGSEDSCGGSPCEAATELIRSGAADRVLVFGLGLEPMVPSLGCAGAYREIDRRSRLTSLFQDVIDEALLADRGRVTVFRPGWGGYVTSGTLGESIPLAAGTYDVVVRSGSRVFRWQNLSVQGALEATAGPNP